MAVALALFIRRIALKMFESEERQNICGSCTFRPIVKLLFPKKQGVLFGGHFTEKKRAKDVSNRKVKPKVVMTN